MSERARCSHGRTDLEPCGECVAQVEAAARQVAKMIKGKPAAVDRGTGRDGKKDQR